jgi:hypothetical protein
LNFIDIPPNHADMACAFRDTRVPVFKVPVFPSYHAKESQSQSALDIATVIQGLQFVNDAVIFEKMPWI